MRGLWLWSAATAVAALGMIVWLPASRFPASGGLAQLAQLAEDPWAVTAAVVAAALASVGLALRLGFGRGAARAARGALVAGAAVAVLGAAAQVTYVHAFSYALSEAPGAPAVGDEAPDFTVEVPKYGPFSLSAQRGKPVLLVFFRAHW